MKRLGLTGNIGSGKSTVAELFAARGAAVIDADRLARDAVEDPEVLAAIAEALGDDLVVDERLDRQRTAERVFEDASARRALELVVHPWVRRASAARLHELSSASRPPQLVVQDIPLLFESGLADRFDATAVVVAPLHVRIERVAARGGMSIADARSRDAAQMPQDTKARLATYVIDNGGPRSALDSQVERIWRELAGGRA